jgi:hypothetical protein
MAIGSRVHRPGFDGLAHARGQALDDRSAAGLPEGRRQSGPGRALDDRRARRAVEALPAPAPPVPTFVSSGVSQPSSLSALKARYTLPLVPAWVRKAVERHCRGG